MAAKSNSYLPHLDGLRAIAAVYVAITHAVLQFQLNYSHLTRFEAHTVSIFAYGHQAVNFFIVISGFCLTIPLVRKNDFSVDALSFYKKRAKRILLPYYCTLLLSLLLIATLIGQKTGTVWDYSLPVTWKDVLFHFFIIQDLYANRAATINHPLWSVSVECRIYLFFPLLLLVWRKFGSLYSLLTAFLISATIFGAVTYLNRYYAAGIFIQRAGINPYIILFAFGMLASYISFSPAKQQMRNRVPWLALSIAALIINRVILQIPFFIAIPHNYELDDILFGLFSALFLVAVSGDKAKFLKTALSYKPLVFIGTFAYSIYLLHAPLLQLIWQYLINPLKLSQLTGYYLMLGVGMPIILLISYLFYLGCERPFMNHKKPVVSQLK